MNIRPEASGVVAAELEALQREHARVRDERDMSRQEAEGLRRSNAELFARFEHLRLAIDSCGVGLWSWDSSAPNEAGEWSPQLRRILGVSMDEPITHELFLQCVHEDDRARVHNAIMQALSGATGGKYAEEYRTASSPSRAERWVSAQGQSFLDAAGNAIWFVGIRDITESKRLQAENYRLGEDFQDLFDEAPIPYVHEGLDTRFIRVNRAALNVLGISADEVTGTFGNSFAVDNPENQQRLARAFESVGRGEPTGGVVLELRRKDNGKPVWVEWWSKPAPGGEFTRTMVVDITDRVLLEQAKKALEFTLKSGQVGDWDLDLIRDTSRRSLRHDECFGYATAVPDAEWGVAQFLRHIHDEDRDRVEAAFRRAVSTLGDWESECRVVWPDNSVHWIAVRGSVYQSEAGKATRMLGIVMDITERKRAEETLRETKAVLEFTLESARVGDWNLDLIHDTSRRSLRHDQCFGYEQPIPEADWGIDVFIRHVHPDDRERVEQGLRGAAQQQVDWRSEFRVVWPDGSLHWLGARGSIYSTSEGRATQMLGIVMDISERKSVEEALNASAQLARGQVVALKSTLDVLVKEASPDKLVGHMLRMIAEQCGAHSSSVWLRNKLTGEIEFEFAFEDGRIVTKDDARFAGMELALPMQDGWPWPDVFRYGKPSLIKDIREVPGFALRDRLLAFNIVSVLLVPMFIGGELEGTIGIRFTQRREFREEEMELAQALANQAMLAMQLTRLSSESRDSAVIAERNRMARDIHDTLAQGFTGVIVQLEAASEAKSKNMIAEADEHLQRAGELARESLNEARRSVRALRPQALEDKDLVTALDGLFSRMTAGTMLRSEFSVQGEPRKLASDWEDNLVRISQEVLTNALRHAHATHFTARLSFDAQALRLSLQDDGQGFNPEGRRDGFGLLGMEERVETMGGHIVVDSAPGSGTQVMIVLPYRLDAQSGSNGGQEV